MSRRYYRWYCKYVEFSPSLEMPAERSLFVGVKGKWNATAQSIQQYFVLFQ